MSSNTQDIATTTPLTTTKESWEGIPILSEDPDELLRYGICKVPLPEGFDAEQWAEELSTIPLTSLGFEGDGEYAFYRNILDEPDFPFDRILSFPQNEQDEQEEEKQTTNTPSTIAAAILKHFPVQDLKELRLDDAFCVHYNMEQDDTTGAKHMDPSDITINMCLQKSKDAQGSYVLFHGTRQLENVPDFETNQGGESTVDNQDDQDTAASSTTKFLVMQTPGFATIHFGDHPHETTPLYKGSRTNVILTLWYTDPNRSDVATRACY
mmetsp:Transcript_8355/g.15409  ORF Transcript_8355/g.15409 Transcript_8355/m.15409 type:complete len:267 (+) Transcript_8355:88-888(+)|eukprot:CAMPEP_0178740930 /NCGR_PEP_ID=MMETSP0744-20121128/4854_1 /TAXON_ID=913974 /ORGANISM="Nitzschia punctata, Strain CCMP561" /LENGTH=266 /DNA_ID=CAMNT_0020393739 /DNA_START=72 /DNA_END=872 /DNA_ORIENTATION=+